MERPVLTEPGVKYWLTQTLKECRKFKDRNISVIFNISMLVLLLLHFMHSGYSIDRIPNFKSIQDSGPDTFI